MKHQASFVTLFALAELGSMMKHVPRQKGCQNRQRSSGRKMGRHGACTALRYFDTACFGLFCCLLLSDWSQGNLFHVPWEIVNVKGPGSHLVRPVRGRQRQFLESVLMVQLPTVPRYKGEALCMILLGCTPFCKGFLCCNLACVACQQLTDIRKEPAWMNDARIYQRYPEFFS